MIGIGAADLDAWLAAYLYPFFRIIALFSSAPMLSHASVPRLARIGLALLLTMLIAPVLPVQPLVSPFSLPGVLLIAQQVLIGVALGFVLQVAFAAAELAGDMIGLQMGLSFASFIDPERSEQTPIIGSFLSLTMMLLFFAINGHLMLLGSLADSFRTLPMGIVDLHWLDGRNLALAGGTLFLYGMQIALPVIGALLLVNLALGVLTRTAPQLNLLAVGFAVTLIVGMLVLLLGLPQLVPMLEGILVRGVTVVTR